MDKYVKNALKVIKKAAGSKSVYIVGGWLRDRLLGKLNADLDIVSMGNVPKIAKSLAAALHGRVVLLDKENRIYRVVLKSFKGLDCIDLARAKGPDIASDLKKRDFTVNAMALEVSEKNPALNMGMLIDPLNGIKDLKSKTVRMICPGAFKDDPLRLLRAFRIASELGFSIDKKTLSCIKRSAALVRKSAGERVREEILKILKNPGSCSWIDELDKNGLLEALIPETEKMKKSARKYYFHPKGLWQHAMETLSGFEEILLKLRQKYPECRASLEKHLDDEFSSGVSRRSVLKIICLLHDVAKPQCAQRIGGKMRFLNHDKKGAAALKAIMERLKFGRREISAASRIVENHMRPISLGQAKIVTPRAVFRLFRDMENETPDLLLLSLADCYSYRRLKVKKAVALHKQEHIIKMLITRFFEQKEKHTLPRIIDGNVLMRELKLEPGPLIGRLLMAVNEAQGIGKITTRAEAVELARRKLTHLKK